MIVASNPIGGLGNQLFQIFATIAYGIQYNRRIIFTYKEQTGGHLSRPTYWHNFLKNLQIFTTKYNKKVTNEDLNTFTKIQEKGHHYTQLLGNIEPNVFLLGYYQTPKYFEKYTNKILELIKFNEIREQVLKTHNSFYEYKEEEKEKSIYVSIHFRLGDYKYLQKCHPVLNYEYYKNSLLKMKDLIENQYSEPIKIKVLYFFEKEDIQIIETKIQKLRTCFPTMEFQSVGTEIEDWEQMVLMTNCNHHIIANSTFSWWGAYLNPSVNKHVIYPSIWFGDNLNHLQTDDLFPDTWIKI
jgi:hypothetical protein